MIERAAYFTSKALSSIRGSPGVSAVTTATIAAALVVQAMFLMAFWNIEDFAKRLGKAATLSAYVADSVPREQWEALRGQLAALPGVDRSTLVEPEVALERFRKRGPEAAQLVEGVDAGVLPASVELTLGAPDASLAAMESLAAAAAAVPGVAEVDYGRAELQRLTALLRVVRYGGVFAALLVGLATAFIVANTIRLTVYARRHEIAIVQLVGATPWFVRIPFLIEGGVWGLCGGAASGALMWLLDKSLAPRLATTLGELLEGVQVRFYDPRLLGALVVAGLVVGVLGSAVAVGRFLDVERL